LVASPPARPKLTGLFFFYSTFFISVIGLFSVIGFLIRWAVIKNKQVMLRHVRKTFRQSITIASLLTISLLFMQFDLLRWWNTLILVALFIIIEGLIFTNRKYHNQEYVA
jgi:predicted transporter